MEPLPFCVYKKGTVEKLFFLDKCYENSIMVDIGSIKIAQMKWMIRRIN